MPQHSLDGPGKNGAQIARRFAGFRLDRDFVAIPDLDTAGTRQRQQIFGGAAGLEQRSNVVGPAEPRRNLAEPKMDVGWRVSRTVPPRQRGQFELRFELKSAQTI